MERVPQLPLLMKKKPARIKKELNVVITMKAKKTKRDDDEFNKEKVITAKAKKEKDVGGGQNKAYKNLAGRQEKADFRRRWAQAQLDQVVESREREDEMKQIDTTKGDMVSIKELIKREGAADAKKYIEKCMAVMVITV